MSSRAPLAVALGAIALLVASCSYSPHYVSGVTQCADTPPLCPGGFVCDTAAGVCVTSLGSNDAATDTDHGDAPADHVADAGTTGGTTDARADTGAGDTRSPDAAPDAGCTANIATSSDNCGACGHSCGGGMCTLGVCQPTTVAGVTAATSISVDATQIYFTTGTKILACPKSGCVLAPTQLDDMGMGGYSTWAVTVTNGNLFFMSAPTQAGTEHDDLFECPLTGCPSPAPIIGVAMPYGVNYLANAGSDVYWADDQVNKTFRRACPPNGGVCDATTAPVVTVLNESFAPGQVAAIASTAFYFVDAAGLQKCPYAGCPGTPPVPTPTVLTTMIPTGVVAYGGLLYLQFGDTMHTLNGAIRTCTPIDCDAMPPKNFIANRDPISALTVDAQGVYWMEDSNIYFCPRTGCVGGARMLASGLVPIVTPGFNAHPIVTDDAFVYWIQDAAGTVMRIAK
jgi:hypothetical protein